MNRREFSKGLIVVGAVSSKLWDGEKQEGDAAQAKAPATSAHDTVREGFPTGAYTPFGYLDNPYHCWDLHQSGVLRSVPAMGIGLYYPAGPGGYFSYAVDSVYRAMLRVGIRVGEQVYFDEADFRDVGIKLIAPHHTKNLLTFRFETSPLAVTLAFFQVSEDTLGCAVHIKNETGQSAPVHIYGVQRVELGPAVWWGRDGLAGDYDAQSRRVLLRSFAAGPVFALQADSPAAGHVITPDDAELKDWMAGRGQKASEQTTYYPEALNAGLEFPLQIAAGETSQCTILMSRAVNQRAADKEVRNASNSVHSVYLDKKTEDDRFWSEAVRLEGDFPQHWKNSWVYDFETLRMMVRRPIGLYHHPWDAMQIQAPRNVLAETSIDMWALSYSDPDVAKKVLLGQFQDAVEPNVPCMREDGTMNMVAADGSECGTSLQWCYPFYCIESVFLRTGDHLWLAQLYPYLTALLDWTLKNRSDKEGWIVAKCSWESGMDASNRFLIKQPTGGELIDFVRVAELQAAMSHAARTMHSYARLLGRSQDIDRWARLATIYAQKTRELFQGDWFYDVDSRTGKPIAGHREVTQVGPIMCGVATPEQVRAMTPLMLEYSPTQGFWLEWASHMLPYAESMWQAGQRQRLSAVLYAIIDRVYRSMDRRSVEAQKKIGWPGVSCEVWGPDGAYGGEGYGWGATLPAHIVRSIVGVREPDRAGGAALELGPNLPDQLAVEGKTYLLRNIHYLDHKLDIRYRMSEKGSLRAELSFSPQPRSVDVTDQSGGKVSVSVAKGTASFAAMNHAVYRVRW